MPQTQFVAPAASLTYSIMARETGIQFGDKFVVNFRLAGFGVEAAEDTEKMEVFPASGLIHN